MQYIPRSTMRSDHSPLNQMPAPGAKTRGFPYGRSSLVVPRGREAPAGENEDSYVSCRGRGAATARSGRGRSKTDPTRQYVLPPRRPSGRSRLTSTMGFPSPAPSGTSTASCTCTATTCSRRLRVNACKARSQPCAMKAQGQHAGGSTQIRGGSGPLQRAQWRWFFQRR